MNSLASSLSPRVLGTAVTDGVDVVTASDKELSVLLVIGYTLRYQLCSPAPYAHYYRLGKGEGIGCVGVGGARGWHQLHRA